MFLFGAFGAALFFAAIRAFSWEISFLRAVSDSSMSIRSRSSASVAAACVETWAVAVSGVCAAAG
jgi:hypothetical protein